MNLKELMHISSAWLFFIVNLYEQYFKTYLFYLSAALCALIVSSIVCNIISLDNSHVDKDSPVRELKENFEMNNTVSDGFNLCTLDFMKKISKALGLEYVTNGVCLRNAWLKGMLYAFPIVEFFDKYANNNYIVTDIWGNQHDIRNVDMILTESSLKLWSA